MARYSPEHKDETRRRMVEAAVTTFRRDGVSAAGLKQIMEELGQTVGGFYRHFPSKSDLVQAAVEHGVQQSLDTMRMIPEDDQFPWTERFTAGYLSSAHCQELANGCVFAALASDIARGDSRVKQSCEAGLQQLWAELGRHLPANGALPVEELWGLVALEIGGLLLSRMVESAETSAEILASCRRTARRVLGSKRQNKNERVSVGPRHKAASNKQTRGKLSSVSKSRKT
ncbi:MAG TPA: TetR/AcrR family transcriptional regulator [Pirellulales bacterium]